MPVGPSRNASTGYIQHFGAAADSGFSFASSPDPNGTIPVRLDVLETRRLRSLFTTNLALRQSNDRYKDKLFSEPFEVYMGESKENVLRPEVKKAVIGNVWNPHLREMHDWITQFGLAPYRIQKRKLTKEMKRIKEKFGDDRTEDANETSSGISKKNEKSAITKKKSGSSSVEESKRRRTLDVWNSENEFVVMDFESGFISTYKNSQNKQKFLWTWYVNAVPKNFDSSNGYTDYTVKFVIDCPPTISGHYTNPLKSALKDYVNIITKKQMEILSMRHHLNPMVFVEKQDSNKSASTSIMDEKNAGYAQLFNMDVHAMAEFNQVTGGVAEMDDQGRLRMPYGRSYALDATGINGLEDAGLVPYDPMFVASRGSQVDYAGLARMLHRNHGSPTMGHGSFETPGGGNSFDFGGLGDGLVTDLVGKTTFDVSDPSLFNPMSGVGYRCKQLREGEKVVEVKEDHLDLFVSKTPILEQEQYFNNSLSNLIGYPLDFGISTNPNNRQGKSKASKNSPSASSSNGSNNFSSGGFADLREEVMDRLIKSKNFYEQWIARLFVQCYSDSINVSKLRVLKKLEEKDWYVLDKVYDITIVLPVAFPKVSTGELMSYYEIGVVDEKEVMQISRLRLGLDLDVLSNPQWMKNAKEKMENKYNIEKQLQLQKKYTSSKDQKPKESGSKTGSKDKDKSGSNSKKRDRGEESKSKKSKGEPKSKKAKT